MTELFEANIFGVLVKLLIAVSRDISLKGGINFSCLQILESGEKDVCDFES